MATTQYWYNGTDLVYEEDDDGLYREYYHGPEGLLSMYDSSGSARRYHFYDGMGSTSEATYQDGTEVGTYTYDAFGVLLPPIPAVTNPFRYIGKHGYYYGAADSMYLLQQRYYRASTGRFWTRDPDGDASDMNSYRYARGFPTGVVDPTGERVIQPGDPRFPKPPRHPPPGWFTTPGLMYWCGQAACAKRAAEDARAISCRHNLPGLLNGPKDALRHCVWGCLVRQRCGGAAYNSFVIDHENGAPWAKTPGSRGGWDWEEGPMDLANDERGRKCAVSGKDCEQCCVDDYHNGDLYILPGGPGFTGPGKKYW